MTLGSVGTVQYEPISMNSTDMWSLLELNDAQLEAFLGGLSVTPQLPTNALPRNGAVGTFFSLQHPNWPPMPGDVNGQPVWQMNGFYLLNDLNFDYAAAAAAYEAANAPTLTSKMRVASSSSMIRPKIMDPNGPPILTVTPTGTNQLLITIINPKNPQNYELLTTPILVNPDYPWTTMAVGTTGQTNFTVNMGPYYTGFYRALQDTNAIPLWQAADPNNQAAGILTVYIDSPTNGVVLQ